MVVASSKGSKIQALIDECECVPPSQTERIAAAKIVCAGAVGDTVAEQAADARTLMSMLGLMPGQEDQDLRVAPAVPLSMQ